MRRLSLHQLPLLVWLALVWVLLWGSWSPLVLLSALVVAPLCLVASRLPVVPTARARLRALPGAVLRFGRDLVTSSAEVAWTTLVRGPRARSAVIAVPVSACSEEALTVVAHRLSLEPGTLVLDFDRAQGVMYMYVLDVGGTENIERARRSAERTAAEVLHALGADRGIDRGATGTEAP